MNPQDILDYVSRFLLTQNAKCLSPRGTCWCQQGTLRCAAASLAIESDVTQWTAPYEIPSINCIYSTNAWHFVCDLIRIHDSIPVDRWEQELAIVALKHGLKPFSQRDLQGRRGKQNPLALWYTNKKRRQRLQKIHAAAGTNHLLEDYLRAWPVVTGGIC